MKRAILLIPLSLAAFIGSHAQSIGPSTLNAAGGTAVIGSHEFDWSVGEMAMVGTFTGSGILVTQGVLQPSLGPLQVHADPNLAKQLKVFPNPATSEVNLQYLSSAAGKLDYTLTDLTGKAISYKQMNTAAGLTTAQINIAELACATYLLEVTVYGEDAEAKHLTYKIQKLK